MRPTVIAGNWKMNNDLEETRVLVRGILSGIDSLPSRDTIIICPPFPFLLTSYDLVRGTRLRLGAQNMSHFDVGAYTGEVSARMLMAVGCTHVIIGHSERRQYYGETDAGVKAKTDRALQSGLIPIVCIGETLAQREQGETSQVIAHQIRTGLEGLTAGQAAGIIIAYEPVWAIGTGKTATPAQAQEVHIGIRSLLAEMFGKASADQTIIQYGGSVKPENAAELLGQPDIDGALVGGACLVAESFLSIARSAKS